MALSKRDLEGLKQAKLLLEPVRVVFLGVLQLRAQNVAADEIAVAFA